MIDIEKQRGFINEIICVVDSAISQTKAYRYGYKFSIKREESLALWDGYKDLSELYLEALDELEKERKSIKVKTKIVYKKR